MRGSLRRPPDIKVEVSPEKTEKGGLSWTTSRGTRVGNRAPRDRFCTWPSSWLTAPGNWRARPEVFSMPRRGVKVSLRRPATLTPLPGHAAGEAGRRRRDGLLTSDSGMEVQLPVRQKWLDKRNPHRSRYRLTYLLCLSTLTHGNY